MFKLNENVIDSNGKPLGGAVVLVRPTGTTSTSLIYSDIAGTSSKANPITSDSLGRFGFYAANSRLDLVVTATGIGTATVVDVSMEDVPLTNLAELTTAATARANLGLAIGTDVQAFDATIAKTTAVNSWTKAQRGAVVALTSTASSIAVDLNAANNFSLTMTEQSTLAAPTNPAAGQGGTIVVDRGTAAYTLSYNSFWKWPQSSTGVLSTATGLKDAIVYQTYSTSAAICQMINNV